MRNPVDTLLTWLEALPSELAEELCGYVGLLLPEGWFDIERFVGAMPNTNVFLAIVADAARSWRKSQYASVGGALALASVVDFVCSTRSTPAQWDDIERKTSEWVFRSHGASQETNRDILLYGNPSTSGVRAGVGRGLTLRAT